MASNSSSMTMPLLSFILLALPLGVVSWTSSTSSVTAAIVPSLVLSRQAVSVLKAVPAPGEMDSELSAEMAENPCWQNMYDDDCSMSSVYSASFVASQWIQTMPCAEGMEDCDFPEEVTLPGTHDKAGIEKADVMDALGLKRATPIQAPPKTDDVAP